MSSRHLPPRAVAALIGLGGIALVTAVFVPLRDTVPTTVPALLLLVPIVATSLLTDWKVAVPVAVAAATAYTLAFIPPVGTVHIGFNQDVFMLLAFVAVAAIVTMLVSLRSARRRVEIDEDRMLLLRSVSHDLRNPLNTIRLASSDLLDGTIYDEGTRSKLLGVVLDESERMERIVHNMLSLSRLQAGALTPTLQPIALDDLLGECLARHGRLGAGHVMIDVDVDADLPLVLADPVQIDQVLANLLENAVRHSSDGGIVRISARVIGDRTMVYVDDTGPGFSPAARAGLFQSHRSETGSTGLGLVLCKAIVEAHDGTIAVGDNPTGGARVSFSLKNAS